MSAMKSLDWEGGESTIEKRTSSWAAKHEYHGYLFFLENGFLSRTCHCILDQASELARRVGGRLV